MKHNLSKVKIIKELNSLKIKNKLSKKEILRLEELEILLLEYEELIDLLPND